MTTAGEIELAAWCFAFGDIGDGTPDGAACAINARETRQEWTYTRPQSRLPVTRVTAEIVAPAPRIRIETPALLEAPGRELVP